MQTFNRELAKAVRRINHNSTNHFQFDRLLEGYMQLLPTPADCVRNVDQFQFSLSFVNTLKNAKSLDNLYLVDGITEWFYTYRQDADNNLFITPNLLRAIYNLDPAQVGHHILIDNPWIMSTFDYFDLHTNTSLHRSVASVSATILEQLLEYLPASFIPKGVWGLDYLLEYRDKTPVTSDNLFIGNLILVPAADYLKSRGEVVCRYQAV